MAQNKNKHEGLQYKSNVTPARPHPQEVEVEAEAGRISGENSSAGNTSTGGSLSTNSTNIQLAACHSYALTNSASHEDNAFGGSNDNIPIAENVTRMISPEESRWKRKYENLLSRLDEEALSIAQELSPEASVDQDSDEPPPSTKPGKHQRRKVIFGVVLFSVMLAPLLAIVIFSIKNEKPGNEKEQRVKEISDFINDVTYTGRDIQNNADSPDPSDKALAWIIGTDRMQLTIPEDRDHLLQRFALMTLIFGQGHHSILNGKGFLHECDPGQFPLFNRLYDCDSEYVIRNITADASRIRGRLSPDVALFPRLEHMNFRNNTWTGPIPTSIGAMAQLKSLRLSGNKFTGEIPSHLGLLTGLAILDLHENDLVGTIPETIGAMTDLQELQLSHNDFDGTIPSSIGNLSLLDRLWLHGNRLSGTLPIALALHQPREILLYNNEFTGPVPFCTAANATQGGVLVADCDRVLCPCCSSCCARSTTDDTSLDISCSP